MDEFDAAGIDVYALSYDEPDALKDFSDAHGITYTLLSDPDSDVIRSFGILNTLIAEDDHPWFGIPYPGTYVVDASGLITHKFFDNNLAVRAGPEQLLRAVMGDSIETNEVQDSSSVSEVTFDLYVEGESLTRTVQRDLVVRFQVPSGRHLYAEPAPAGSVAVDIRIEDDPSLVMRPLVRPPSEPHQLAGTDEVFEVHHDQFELRLPLTVNDTAPSQITLTGELVWQSCDDLVCDIPVREPFQITAPVTAAPAVALGNKTGAAKEPNAMAHFIKMTERRK